VVVVSVEEIEAGVKHAKNKEKEEKRASLGRDSFPRLVREVLLLRFDPRCDAAWSGRDVLYFS